MNRRFLRSVTGIAVMAACSALLATRTAADGPHADSARYILDQTGVERGYCLVFGAGDGKLATALAAQSELSVIGIDDDSADVEAARRALHEADLYGKRIALHHGSLDTLPYRDYAAALVVSQSIIDDGYCSGSAAEMYRMVRPDGGVALLGQPPGCANRLVRAELEQWLSEAGLEFTVTESSEEGLWARVERGPLPGAGEWTHMWADVGNTACSGDERTTDAYKVLWFGEPGPRIMVDRHWEPVAPLYKDGRLFVPGFDRVICSDAYNGARLWDLEVPGASRIAMMRDAGFLALDGEYLHVAVEGRCLQVDVATGEVERALQPPTEGRDWGCVAVDGDLLLGSEQIPGASYLAARTGRGAEGNQLGRGDNRMLITSKALFCLDRVTGALLWRYANDQAVIGNPTICVGGGAVFFMESTDPATVSDTDGRVRMAGFTEGSAEHLVKLDERTGAVLWRRQRDMACRHVLHLSYAKGIVLASGCTTRAGNFWYHLRAYRAEDGALAWERDLDSTFADSDKDHGKQDKHPLIIGDTVQLKQGNFDLMTGEPRGLSFSTTNCADCAASMNHIYTRNKSVATVISLDDGGDGSPLCSTMRPGCYISIIPAGGIVMLPAFSAGCTCAHTIQTTIAWLPQ